MAESLDDIRINIEGGPTPAQRRWLDSLPTVEDTLSGHWNDCKCDECLRMSKEIERCLTHLRAMSSATSADA